MSEPPKRPNLGTGFDNQATPDRPGSLFSRPVTFGLASTSMGMTERPVLSPLFSSQQLSPNRGGLSLELNTRVEERQRQNIEQLYREVLEHSGELNFGDKKVKIKMHELKRICEVGNGSCGHVSRRSYEGYVMAVKEMIRTQDELTNKRIVMDLNTVMRAHECRYIVHSYGYFINDVTVSICMEMMATCLDRLVKKVGPIPEEIIAQMNVSILQALTFLKDKLSIIHRDVKPSNILLDWNGNVKLCDFGISGQLIASKVQSRQAGCPPYMAPERFNEFVTEYDVRSDVWSLGMTLTELARGRFPYDGNEFEILTKIMSGPEPLLRREENFSANFVDYVAACLTRDVERRPKYPQLMMMPFVNDASDSQITVEDWMQDVFAEED